MKQPKLILINGFAGSGKTTIAKRYIAEHPLALSIEGDEIIGMIGQWVSHEKEAREQVFALSKSMVFTHLSSGKNVLLPWLLTDASHAKEFENIAKNRDAHFFEIFLSSTKEVAIGRLMERGTWGEAGVPPITEKDLPIINNLYDTMFAETIKRKNTVTIDVLKDDIDHTYKELLRAIGEI